MQPTANRHAEPKIFRGFLQLTPSFVMIARNLKQFSLES